MSAIGNQYIINFTNIKIKDGGKKKVISTNIFIPQVMEITTKHFMYLTGLIKSVETFKEKMGPDWIYRIYYDKMFDTMFVNRGNHNSLNKVYTKANNNTPYNNMVKNKYNNNKDIIKKYITIINLYFKKIIANEDNKYDFVELISFDCPKLREKKYLGHPDTFGSLMRFFAFFDPNVDLCYCVNSSHSISSYLAKHLKYFAGKNGDRYAYSNLIGNSKNYINYQFREEDVNHLQSIFETKDELVANLKNEEAILSNNKFPASRKAGSQRRIIEIKNKLAHKKENAQITRDIELKHLEKIYIEDEDKITKEDKTNSPTENAIFKLYTPLITGETHLSFNDLFNDPYYPTILSFRRLPAGLIGVKTNASIQSTFVKKKDYIYKKFIEILEILTNDINNFKYGIDEYILALFILPSISGQIEVYEQDKELILKGDNESVWLENKPDDSTEIKQDLSFLYNDLYGKKDLEKPLDDKTLSFLVTKKIGDVALKNSLAILNRIVYDKSYHRLFSISFVLNIILKIKTYLIQGDKPINDNKLIICAKDTKNDFVKYLCSFNEIKPLILYDKKIMNKYETEYKKKGNPEIENDILASTLDRYQLYKNDSLALSTFLIINNDVLQTYFTIIDFSDDSKTTMDLLEEIITYYKNPKSYNEIEIVKCSLAGGRQNNKYKKQKKTHNRKLLKKNTIKSKKSKKE